MNNIITASKTIYQTQNNILTDRLKWAVDEVQDNDCVLEIGVGKGEIAQHIRQHKKVEFYAVDVSESALEGIKEFTKDSQLADISNQKLKFKDNQFDTVICLEVFEHLQNPYQALAEIQRVLKPRGKLVLSIPNSWGGHLMIYPGLMTSRFLRAFLHQNFFKIIRFRMWGAVWNKDNVGIWLKTKVRYNWLCLVLLRLLQVVMRLLQIIGKPLGSYSAGLYWCYCFICENYKDQSGDPFWMKQFKQTTILANGKGWYDPEFRIIMKNK